MILLTFLNWLLFVTAGYWTLALGFLLVLFAISNRDRPVPVLATDLVKGDLADDYGPAVPSEAIPGEGYAIPGEGYAIPGEGYAIPGEGYAIAEETHEAMADAPQAATEQQLAATREQTPAAPYPLCGPTLFVAGGLIESPQQSCS